MVEEFVSIWKLLSLLFFVVLFLFLFHIVLEKILSKREFKRNLRLAKDQLFSDIFKNDDWDVSEFLSMDETSGIELEVRQSLKELKKKIFCDLSKYDLKSLESKINTNFKEKESRINKIVLNKYKDAIKSLNDKIIYLKNDLDWFKSVLSDSSQKVDKNMYVESQNNYVRLNSSMKWVEKSLENKIDFIFKNKDEYIQKQIDYLIQNNEKLTTEKMKMIVELQQKNELFMKENLDKVYELIKEKDFVVEEKRQLISEQHDKISWLENKLFVQEDFIKNKIEQYSMDREYLDQYINTIKSQTKTQGTKNTMFIFAMIVLFGVTLTMLFLIITKSPIIYSLY